MNKKTTNQLFWYKIFLTLMIILQLFPLTIGIRDVIVLVVNFISGSYFTLRLYLCNKLGSAVKNGNFTLRDIINMRKN